ncbi:MAG: bifunctional phosphoribosyl-AMP cyclohydrolase/phosphoribosyl-ATP diphosphatase HisIE [Anaerofustis stercorihominis]|nr:bifunctional phosphoribosyl-AMP cyclohydrolase/phosphoribosyl-ATP diphosphatase HisIE [Anaerofustis stercorihominis]
MQLKYDEKGLIPAVVQNAQTGKVLMLGYMNEESLELTKQKNQVVFFSRSRNELWHKGETSGNYLDVVSIAADCDGDSLLIKAVPHGPTCHTGEESCFFNNIEVSEPKESYDFHVVYDLFDVIKGRKENPIEGSYTNYLFDKGIDKILKKVGEESAETIIAAKNNAPDEIIYETSDLIYHLLVMLCDRGVDPKEIFNALHLRRSGKY